MMCLIRDLPRFARTGKVWWEVAPVQFTPSFPADGRSSGSPPGHTGETLGPSSHPLSGPGWVGLPLPKVTGRQSDPVPVPCPAAWEAD